MQPCSRLKGKMQEGITLRDLVNAIPLYAIKAGLLIVEKKGKINAGEVYRYMNFDQIPAFVEQAATVEM